MGATVYAGSGGRWLAIVPLKAADVTADVDMATVVGWATMTWRGARTQGRGRMSVRVRMSIDKSDCWILGMRRVRRGGERSELSVEEQE